MTLPSPATGADGRACALPGSPLDAARAGLDACVHCGFCLPACPTYLNLEDENDSPRGRLVLMGALLEGRLAPTDPALEHIDRCLGCRGCETACPSGVPYGALLEATRASLRPVRALPWRARLVLAVFAREWLLRPMLAAARAARTAGLARLAMRLLPRSLAMPAAMLASTQRLRAAAAAVVEDPATRGTAALLTGCVMEGLLAPVNRATERVLARRGWRMTPVPGQACCGALHAHAGDLDTARDLARRNVQAFDRADADVIVMNSAGCGSMCKDYGHLLADDPAWATRAQAFASRVRDVHELLAEAVEGDPRRTNSGREPAPSAVVAWDAPCHLQHAQRIVLPPLAVLRATPGITLVPLVDSDLCCGSAGVFSLTRPHESALVLEPKLAHVAASGAEVLATGNPGCLMQIGGGLLLAGSPVVSRHPVELLDLADGREGARQIGSARG
jgi:glycolate oxidase iron-sulfur subunit